MTELPFLLERTIVIAATRSTVWRFFTDSERFARWWGPGSMIDARVGGAVRICYPGGSTASGEVREVVPERRIVFTYGYDDSSKPIGPGGSVVTIELVDAPAGTRLELRHAVHDEAVRDQHVPGWRYQLAVFSRVVTDEQHASVAEAVDRYFAAWNADDEGERKALLEGSVVEAVSFADAFGVTDGLDELAAHVQSARMHFAGVRLKRRGPVRHVQGTALADWVAERDGQAVMQGTNVFELAPDGRIRRVVGIASA